MCLQLHNGKSYPLGYIDKIENVETLHTIYLHEDPLRAIFEREEIEK